MGVYFEEYFYLLCIYRRSHTTIARYAQYQASSFKESLKEERDKSASGLSDSDSKDSMTYPKRRKTMNLPPSSNSKGFTQHKMLK